jgi:hypothetical protein
MSAETDMQALLAGYAPLRALVGNRIGLGAVPPPAGNVLDAVVYQARHLPVLALDNALLADAVNFTVQCWGEGAVAAAAVAAQVRAALATAPAVRGCVITAEETLYDEETGLDGVVLTVEWWAAV